jgi:hypothetical protein
MESAMTDPVTKEEFVARSRGLWQEIKPKEAVLIGPGGQRGIPQLPAPEATSQQASENPTRQWGGDRRPLYSTTLGIQAVGTSSHPVESRSMATIA